MTTKREEWRGNWKVVLAAAAGMSLAALSTASFGVMLVPIEQDLGWTRAEISLGPALITAVVFCLSSLLGGAIDRFGPRKIGAVAVLVICGAMAMMSRIGSSLWGWWAIWVAIGLGSAMMPTVWLKPVSTSFFAGRGLALAVVLSGTSISAILVPSLANHLVEAHGWRWAYAALGGIWCVAVLPLVLLFLRQGAARVSNDSQAAAAAATPPTGLTVREGFKSSRLYRLLLTVWCSTFMTTAIVLNLVPMLRANGFTAATAASIAGFAGFSLIGRFTSGWLLDRYDAGRIGAVAALFMVVLPGVLLLFPNAFVPVMLAVLVFSLASGALLPSFAYLTSQHLGERSFGTFYGTVNAVNSIGVGLGPLLANTIYDQSGSYRLTLLAAIPMLVAGAALFLSLGRRSSGRATREAAG
ncbi:MAG: MFS transporter [Novosphingobium sp.]